MGQLQQPGWIRRGALLAGLALALTAAGLVGGAAAAPSLAPVAAGAQECVPAASDTARVKPGSHADEPSNRSSSEIIAAEKKLNSRLQSKKLAGKKLSAFPKVTVPVWVHVITKQNGTGAVTDRQIARQINVLNQAFAGRVSGPGVPTLFRFRLAGTTVTPNDDWYSWSDPDVDPNDDREAKAKLRKGGRDTLNLYVTGLEDGLLGYAYFPDESTLTQDGVVVLNDSLPGGSDPAFSLGDTTTHEVGHWLGLYHTFENGCSGPGDEVADTPYQYDGDNIFSCKNDDTCSQPGRDPVHNYMSYGDDFCLDRFSAGQSLRMALTWFAYRQLP